MNTGYITIALGYWVTLGEVGASSVEQWSSNMSTIGKNGKIHYYHTFSTKEMSREWLKTIIAERQKARDEFTLEDTRAVILSATTPFELRTLKPASSIIVTGFVPKDASRFSLNLLCKTPGDIALHFNPRLDRGYVVRNTKVKNHWQTEETSSPLLSYGSIFRTHAYFHVLIFCTVHEFQIAVNGEHFCSYPYRIPLSEIESLKHEGDVEETRGRQMILDVYPDPRICKPKRSLELIEEKPLRENLQGSVTIRLPKGVSYGTRLFIKGRLKLLPYSFYVNLQKGQLIYPHPEIALHINPRFSYGNAAACVVMNCWTEGKWSQEERHEGHLSWAPGRDFLLTIRVEVEGYTIWLSNKMIGEFKHRMEPSIVDTLQISGDLVLHEIAISYDS